MYKHGSSVGVSLRIIGRKKVHFQLLYHLNLFYKNKIKNLFYNELNEGYQFLQFLQNFSQPLFRDFFGADKLIFYNTFIQTFSNEPCIYSHNLGKK